MRTEPSFSAEPDDQILNTSTDSRSSLHDTGGVADDHLLTDYRQRYGLSIDPFADDHHFPFYTGAQRRLVLDQLLHLCQFSHNLLVVLGDYGVGKTRVAQALIDSLADADDICFVEGQIDLTFELLVKSIFDQFELEDSDKFADFINKEANPDGLAVVIIDNAHHIDNDVLQQLISYVYSELDSRLHIVLLAEPHLLPRLESMDVADVVISDFFLAPLSLVESVDYLNFRMEMADYLGPELFTESKVDAWWRKAEGQLLSLHDFAQNDLLSRVTAAPKSKLSYRSFPVPHIIGVSVLGGALLMGGLYWAGGGSSEPKVATVVQPIPVSKVAEPLKPEVEEKITQTNHSEQAAAAVNASSLAASVQAAKEPISASANPSPVTTAEPVVKQSVVPLAQTNSISQVQSSKSIKSASVSSVADVKKKDVLAKEDIAPSKSPKETVEKPKNVKDTVSAGYTDQEKTILAWSESEFTLQLVGLSTEKAAHEFIAEQANKKDLLVFKGQRQGKDWFVVVTGRYTSSAKARQSIQQLPESQKKASPWPREIKVVQREIKQR